MRYLIFLFVLFLFSCNSEESEGCNCKGKFISYEEEYYYIDNLNIDCNTRKPNELDQYIGNGYFVECAEIDY